MDFQAKSFSYAGISSYYSNTFQKGSYNLYTLVPYLFEGAKSIFWCEQFFSLKPPAKILWFLKILKGQASAFSRVL